MAIIFYVVLIYGMGAYTHKLYVDLKAMEKRERELRARNRALSEKRSLKAFMDEREKRLREEAEQKRLLEQVEQSKVWSSSFGRVEEEDVYTKLSREYAFNLVCADDGTVLGASGKSRRVS